MNNEGIKTVRKQNVNFCTGMQQVIGEKDVYSASFVRTQRGNRMVDIAWIKRIISISGQLDSIQRIILMLIPTLRLAHPPRDGDDFEKL